MSVAGLVLAAGAGRRIGGPKALVEFGGSTLVQRCSETLAHGAARRSSPSSEQTQHA